LTSYLVSTNNELSKRCLTNELRKRKNITIDNLIAKNWQLEDLYCIIKEDHVDVIIPTSIEELEYLSSIAPLLKENGIKVFISNFFAMVV
jgi:hypothetical protein